MSTVLSFSSRDKHSEQCNRSKLPRSLQSGISLVEIIVCLIILSIFAGYALNPMREMLADYSMRATTDEILSHLEYARSEAIKRGNTRIVVSPKDTVNFDWANQGWRVFIDNDNNGLLSDGDVVLRDIDRPANSMSVQATITDLSCAANPLVLPFNGSTIGFLANTIVHPNDSTLIGCLKINHNNYPELSRDIVISFNGRIRSKKYNEV